MSLITPSTILIPVGIGIFAAGFKYLLDKNDRLEIENFNLKSKINNLEYDNRKLYWDLYVMKVERKLLNGSQHLADKMNQRNEFSLFAQPSIQKAVYLLAGVAIGFLANALYKS